MLYTLYRVYPFVKPYCSHPLILFSDLILHGSAVGLAKWQNFIIYKRNIPALTPRLSIILEHTKCGIRIADFGNRNLPHYIKKTTL
jgi:hypothetical protein